MLWLNCDDKIGLCCGFWSAMLPSMTNTLLLILAVFIPVQLPYISQTISYEWVSVGE